MQSPGTSRQPAPGGTFRGWRTLRRCFALLLALGFLVSVRNSAQQTLTTVPAGSTINVSVSVQPPSGGKVLSYRWKATDGVVVDLNAPSTTWTLPKGQGLNFLYVLVSDSQGGYTEKQIAISTTDPNATDRAVVSGDPLPAIPPLPPSGTPLGTLRGWLEDNRPDVLLKLIDSTGASYGPITTDDQGQYVFHNLPNASFTSFIADAPGQPFRLTTEIYAFSDGMTAYSDYSGGDFASTQPDRLGNTIISGHVTLANSLPCGVSSTFFGLQVNATATLIDGWRNVLHPAVRVNAFGNYEIDANVSTSGTYYVQVQCEQSPPYLAPLSVTVTPGLANIYQGVNVTIPSTAPVVTGLAASLNGTPIQLPSASTTPLPSDSVPWVNQFLSTKGLDSRIGACLYYRAVGAVVSCDANGTPAGAINFDAWKRQSGLAPYNTSAEATATYVNAADLNVVFNHHGIQTASGVSMYLCAYPGPADDTVQEQVNAAVADAVNNRNLAGCVAMDYLGAPGVNGGVPFTRFLAFGPSGRLLPSVNLDGRGEKFVPGLCVTCHGGDSYAGRYPTDGSGIANIGTHFLPADTGNLVFSNSPGLQLADQAAQIKVLNQLVLQTSPTTSTANLINAWYQSGSNLQDNSYVPTGFSTAANSTGDDGPFGPIMYAGVIKHSCRTCHVVLPLQYDLDRDGDHHGSSTRGMCGGTGAFETNHNMPNSKVTYDRMWLSKGSTTPGADQIAIVNAWLDKYNGGPGTCSSATPDPPPVHAVTSYQPYPYQPACSYTFWPAQLSLSGQDQTATAILTATGSGCSGVLSSGSFVTAAPSNTPFNPGSAGTVIPITVPANRGAAARADTVTFNDGTNLAVLGITQSNQVTQVAQTIAFGPLRSAALGAGPFALAAGASSGLPVAFASMTNAVCTVTGSVVALVAAGTCSITASQAGNTNYAAAPSVTRSFAVTGSSPINFDVIPDEIYGVSPFPITARAGSGLVGFASTTPAVCRTAGDLVTLRSTGTCSITASQGINVNTRSFTVKPARPSGGFWPDPGSPFALLNSPNSVAVGDFNGDGIPDLATAMPYLNSVMVLLGNGSGGFTVATGSPFGVGGNAYSVVVGDFNGDGIQDLATANSFSDNVTVLLGNGSGGFAVAAGSPITLGTTVNPYSVVVGDFNGDGIQDLATANFSSNNVTVLLGNGAGGFTAAPGSPFAVGTSPYSVAVGDFNGDGIQDLATANSASNNVTVLLGNGAGGFTPAAGSPFAAGASPYSVAVGDFNSDGIQDLVTAGFVGSSVTVLLGNGSGGFTPAAGSPFAVGTGPDSVVVGDFNGDGIQDLATANSGSNDITVLLGNGSGGFTAAGGNPFPVGTGPHSVVVADFNGDGSEDLATANLYSSDVTVLLGSGIAAQTITFSPPGTMSCGAAPLAIGATATSGLPVSFASTTPAVCTVSGNTLTIAGAGTCSIAAHQGGNLTYAPATVVQSFQVTPGVQTTTFGPLSNRAFGTAPFALTATASSGLPVAFASTTSAVCRVTGNLVTLAAAGTCSITATPAVSACYPAATPVVQSFQVTQGVETISADSIPTQILGISPFPITGRASSGLAMGFASTTPAVCRTAGGLVMLRSAGLCSITVSQGGIATARNLMVKLARPAGGLAPHPASPFAVGTGPASAAVGDFNGDGIPDIATANFTSDNVTVLLGNGSGGFLIAPGSPFAVGSNPNSVVVGDFNGDGVPDLATANFGDNNVTVLLGNGLGGFTVAAGGPFAVGINPSSLVVGDFNGDGIEDLATANYGSNNVTVLLGNGLGGFTPAAGSPFAGVSGGRPVSLAVGDFNGDGIQDLAVANSDIYSTNNNVTVFLGNGSGGFTEAMGSPFAVGTGPISLVVGDFNGDGIQDIATANNASSDVTVLLGNGAGGFTAAAGSPFAVGTSPYSVVAGDLNGDGRQDLATANVETNNITVLLGNGSGGFTAAPESPLAAGIDPISVVVGDFNGDGLEDLAAANFGGDNVTVLLGAGTTPQAITFGSLSNVNSCAAPFTPTATASSGLPINFASTTPAVCTVAGNKVTVLATGTCSITASQGGNASYAPATPVTQSFTVTQCPPSITVSNTPDAAIVVAGSSIGYTLKVSNGATAGTPAATSVTLSDPLPTGTGLSWSISPGYSGPGTCSITGVVGNQTLGCNLGDMAAGGMASVHVTSSTSVSICAAYSNTATVSASNSSAVQSSATATVPCTKAVMSTPPPGSKLSGSTVTFTWSVGAGASAYWLDVGTVQGQGNLFGQNVGLVTSQGVSGIPTDGSAIYVRLWTQINGVWSYIDYLYSASGGTKAVMSTPVPGSTLSGSTVTFTWSGGAGASAYWLDVGTVQGQGNLFGQNVGLVTSQLVSGIPLNGGAIYVRLWTELSGVWSSNSYTYMAASSTNAVMSTQPPGSTLSGSTVTFTWSAGAGASAYQLDVGTALGQGDIFGQNVGLATSQGVGGIPTNGSTIYVRLGTQINGNWNYSDYTYTASSGMKAAMSTPPPGSTLSGSTVTFTWSAGAGASAYWLDVGTVQGQGNLFGQNVGLVTSQAVSGIPTNGSAIYARLWTLINGNWAYADYTYAGASIGGATRAVMSTPVPGSTLSGSTVTFTWSAGTGASAYWLDVGTAQGQRTIFAANVGLVTSQVVSGIPANGGAISVRLWTLLGGTWQYNDYAYTAAGAAAAAISSPGPGSTLSGSTVTFTWSAGPGASAYWLDVGTAQGQGTVYGANVGLATSQVVSGIPTNGSVIYVRLWTLLGGVWQFHDYSFAAFH